MTCDLEECVCNSTLSGKLLSSTDKERLLQLWVVCTMGMLKNVYGNNAMLLRRNVWENELLEERVKNYTKSGHQIREWDLGKLGHFAGIFRQF